MLVFDWSGVISIYNYAENDFNIIHAEIDTEHMRTATKGPRGRPVTNWDFIFSPEKFDNEIGLEQFSGAGIPFDDL